MKFIKFAALSFLAGNAVDAAEPEVSEACSTEIQTFEACATEGFSNDLNLLFDYLRVVGESADCFEAAHDDAAVEACFAPLWGILVKACPSGVDALKSACDTTSDEFGDLAIDMFENIADDLEDAAAFLEDEEEDKFIAVDAAEPEVSEECKTEIETFEACATEGFSKDLNLLFDYLRVVGESADCFEAANDDAAIETCFAPLLESLAKACPGGLDALKGACDTTSAEFKDLAFDVFWDISQAEY